MRLQRCNNAAYTYLWLAYAWFAHYIYSYIWHVCYRYTCTLHMQVLYITYKRLVHCIYMTYTLRETHVLCGGHRVVGNIWCIGAGEPSPCPVSVENSASPQGWLVLHLLGGGVCKIKCITWCICMAACRLKAPVTAWYHPSVIHSASVSVEIKVHRNFFFYIKFT